MALSPAPVDWGLVVTARDMRDRPDVVTMALAFGLCSDCRSPFADRHHSPDYRMDRSPYDIPGHKFVDMSDALAAVKAAGGPDAVLAAVPS